MASQPLPTSEAPHSTPREVLFIGTGGTLASFAPSPLQLHDYESSLLPSSALVARFTSLSLLPGVAVVPIDVPPLISDAIGPREWSSLCRKLSDARAGHPDAAGMVVGHGTATMEETAYLLDLLVDNAGWGTVVLTGAMLPASAAGGDAEGNILAACTVAADPRSEGRGVLVVMYGEVHAARDVSKTSAEGRGAFKSPGKGPLGLVDARGVDYFRRAEPRPSFGFLPALLDSWPRVDVSYAYAGCDGTAVRAFVAAGARGIVSAGFAPGGTSPAEEEALDEAANAGVIVVQSTRTGGGRVVPTRRMAERGWIPAGDQPPCKARVLLAMALVAAKSHDEVSGMFATAGRGPRIARGDNPGRPAEQWDDGFPRSSDVPR
ncbi:asparaginase [Hyaloraphidium curvatum]|nr:asparaginase [Hyaloraphidium curvatum]